ncbi:MAG TPA: Ppx/GppA phosphatase family protein [bacterium]|nr:Ppx/GppA phosphatase family protein [bacterium]
MGTFGAIDLGSNTVRLLVANKERGLPLRACHSSQAIPRLSEGLWRNGKLQRQAMDRTLEVLREFRRQVQDFLLDGIQVVATSPLRLAENRQEFISLVQNETGWAVQVVSPHEEARLAVLGVTEALPNLPGRFVVVDIGGGSTELVGVEGGSVGLIVSLNLGAVRLTESFLSEAPVPAHEFARMEEAIGIGLKEARAFRSRWTETPLVGTAGTMTTLAAIDLAMESYDPLRINGHKLSRWRIVDLLESLRKKSRPQLEKVAGLERGREDIIVAGAALARALVDFLNAPEILISDFGVREGILIDQFLKTYRKS